MAISITLHNISPFDVVDGIAPVIE